MSIYGQLQIKTPIDLQIKEKKWKWMGHTLRSDYNIAREALRWNQQRKRKALHVTAFSSCVLRA
jgi:hypothetical protein